MDKNISGKAFALDDEQLLSVNGGASNGSDTIYTIIEDACIGCGSCYSVCPMGAIEESGYYSYKINLYECIGCGRCKEVCPVNAIKCF